MNILLGYVRNFLGFKRTYTLFAKNKEWSFPGVVVYPLLYIIVVRGRVN